MVSRIAGEFLVADNNDVHIDQDGRDLAIVRMLAAAQGDGPIRVSVDYYHHGGG